MTTLIEGVNESTLHKITTHPTILAMKQTVSFSSLAAMNNNEGDLICFQVPTRDRKSVV